MLHPCDTDAVVYNITSHAILSDSVTSGDIYTPPPGNLPLHKHNADATDFRARKYNGRYAYHFLDLNPKMDRNCIKSFISIGLVRTIGIACAPFFGNHTFC